MDQFIRLSISLRKRVQSLREVILRYNKISSAYNLIFEVTFRGISFTKHRKRRGEGLILFLGGTPDITFAG